MVDPLVPYSEAAVVDKAVYVVVPLRLNCTIEAGIGVGDELEKLADVAASVI